MLRAVRASAVWRWLASGLLVAIAAWLLLTLVDAVALREGSGFAFWAAVALIACTLVWTIVTALRLVRRR